MNLAITEIVQTMQILFRTHVPKPAVPDKLAGQTIAPATAEIFWPIKRGQGFFTYAFGRR